MTVPPATRGLLGRKHIDRDPRPPPGQYDAGQDVPVLTAEVTPTLDPKAWTMSVDGLGSSQQTWTWDELHRLPGSEYQGDIHCVARWPKLERVRVERFGPGA